MPRMTPFQVFGDTEFKPVGPPSDGPLRSSSRRRQACTDATFAERELRSVSTGTPSRGAGPGGWRRPTHRIRPPSIPGWSARASCRARTLSGFSVRRPPQTAPPARQNGRGAGRTAPRAQNTSCSSSDAASQKCADLRPPKAKSTMHRRRPETVWLRVTQEIWLMAQFGHFGAAKEHTRRKTTLSGRRKRHRERASHGKV